MKMYAIKIALRGVSPMIWRRLRIPGHTSLADFHHVIQIVFGWDDEHLHRFHIYGKDYGTAYAGGLSFSDDAHLVFIDDFAFDVGDRFIYEYNFFESWLHNIRVEAIETRMTSSASPLYACYTAVVTSVGIYPYERKMSAIAYLGV